VKRLCHTFSVKSKSINRTYAGTRKHHHFRVTVTYSDGENLYPVRCLTTARMRTGMQRGRFFFPQMYDTAFDNFAGLRSETTQASDVGSILYSAAKHGVHPHGSVPP
jgi:hypothetical protein